MGKMETLSKLARITQIEKAKGNTVGLITGCFDVIHFGHIQLFRFAKSKVDIVVVGLENDKTIHATKGDNHPFHTIRQRKTVLEELESIDYVFEIKQVCDYKIEIADKIQFNICSKLKPTHLVTNAPADTYWKAKKDRADKLGITFLNENKKRESSSSLIIDKLELV